MQNNFDKKRLSELVKDIGVNNIDDLMEVFKKAKEEENGKSEQVTQLPAPPKVANRDNEIKVTTFEDLEKFKNGVMVRLPEFGEGQSFVAMLRSPSIMNLAANGHIPNSLLTLAAQLFTGGIKPDTNTDDNSLKGYFEICSCIAKAALVEPTWEDIENAGMHLTDRQLMAIFNYTQVGLKSLEAFL